MKNNKTKKEDIYAQIKNEILTRKRKFLSKKEKTAWQRAIMLTKEDDLKERAKIAGIKTESSDILIRA